MQVVVVYVWRTIGISQVKSIYVLFCLCRQGSGLEHGHDEAHFGQRDAPITWMSVDETHPVDSDWQTKGYQVHTHALSCVWGWG